MGNQTKRFFYFRTAFCRMFGLAVSGRGESLQESPDRQGTEPSQRMAGTSSRVIGAAGGRMGAMGSHVRIFSNSRHCQFFCNGVFLDTYERMAASFRQAIVQKASERKRMSAKEQKESNAAVVGKADNGSWRALVS